MAASDIDSNNPEFYIKKAEELFKGFGPLKAWFVGEDKYEIAAEHYNKAAILLGRTNIKRAAEMKIQEAKMLIESSGDLKYKKLRIVNAYKEAGQFYKKINEFHTAISTYELALPYSIMNNDSLYEIYGLIGDLYESNDLHEKALNAYETQAEYINENHQSLNKNPLLKVAELSIILQKYERAIEIYEYIATAYKDKGVLRFKGCDYFLLSSLCYIINDDYVGLTRALTTYPDKNHAFLRSKESELVNNIIGIINPENTCTVADKIKQYSTLCQQYDNIKTLSPILVIALTKVKDVIDPHWRNHTNNCSTIDISDQHNNSTQKDNISFSPSLDLPLDGDLS